MASAPYKSNVLGLLQSTLSQVSNDFRFNDFRFNHVISEVDRFDRDAVKLKQWLEELDKILEVRAADLPGKKNVVYQHNTGFVAEFVMQRLQGPGRNLSLCY